MKKTMIIIALAFLAAATIQAQERQRFGRPPTMDTLEEMKAAGQWDLETRTVLAQAVWGEAGTRETYARTRTRRIVTCGHRDAATECFENRDWKLIPWVLLGRWADSRRSGSSITFVEMIRAYSAPVRPILASDLWLRQATRARNTTEIGRIYRRRFLQSIAPDGSNMAEIMERYRRQGDPEVFRESWEILTGVVDEWGQGRIPHPCEDARHWDMAGSSPSGMVRIDCGETLNSYHARPLGQRPGS